MTLRFHVSALDLLINNIVAFLYCLIPRGQVVTLGVNGSETWIGNAIALEGRLILSYQYGIPGLTLRSAWLLAPLVET
jgi:hypothetical protein